MMNDATTMTNGHVYHIIGLGKSTTPVLISNCVIQLITDDLG